MKILWVLVNISYILDENNEFYMKNTVKRGLKRRYNDRSKGGSL